jgi:tripeptide aminopeptidase
VAAEYPGAVVNLTIENTYHAYKVDRSHPTVAMLSRALDGVGLAPRLEASGGGSDANVFFENGIAALPVGIGVRSFHTKEETARIPEIVQAAQVCERVICGV